VGGGGRREPPHLVCEAGGVESEAGSPARDEPDLRRVGLHPDFWYPLARSWEVKPGGTLLASYGGAPIVLARTDAGEVFALDDRCAHRQFPLHRGVVRGEVLTCAYHAWSYRKSGDLAAVPYLPKGACRPRGVRSYRCREAYGYVFVFTGEAEKAERVSFPELPAFHSARRRTMHFWRKVACHYSFMHENLIDMNHQFLHRGIMGTLRPVLLEWNRGEDWVEARYRMERAGGKGDRGADFLSTGRGRSKPQWERGDLMTIRTQYPYQTLSIRPRGSDASSFDLWAAYVPTDPEQRQHVSVGMLMIEKLPVPGLLHLLWPFIRRFAESVFTEDRTAVEAEQRAYDQQREDRNQEINPVLLALRQVLRRNGVPLPARP
jgi:phenylpropionate dioxygenase-like ring-hydroxylating dioxygenase large terminal subunit